MPTFSGGLVRTGRYLVDDHKQRSSEWRVKSLLQCRIATQISLSISPMQTVVTCGAQLQRGMRFHRWVSIAALPKGPSDLLAVLVQPSMLPGRNASACCLL